ncbi:lactadherin-like [Stylophora pistillata]|uniref:lactadherin-like n=1 Tax=Stylophora pistillata TaxID=50429 RepID=UPI000C047BE1|nr:lactadherin-like [Stylophora pistillata]
MGLLFARIFVFALAISFSYADKSTLKIHSTNEKHEEGKLSLQKRSVYINPLLVYRCSLPLGLENGHVPDAAFSASSSAHKKRGPARSRLNIQSNSKGYGSWSAGANDGKQWLQIDFGELVRVTKVASQGRQDSNQWVTKYTLSYSVDGMHWAEYKENSVTWVFPGNKDRNTVVEHLLLSPFNARLIRFHPRTYHGYTSMRAEVYGCRKVHSCSVPLGVEDKRIPDSAFTASNSVDNRHRPSLARLNLLSDGKHIGAWCPKKGSKNQWLQIDLGEVTALTKVATQGRYSSEDRLTTYTLSYSVDGLHWTSYKQRAVEKVFAGNTDRNTAIVHPLKPHIEARSIRFHPRTHNHNGPCFRVELYGCRKVKNCLMPVGVEDGRIPDEAFSASSSASSSYLPNRGRLNLAPSGGKHCWAAGQNNANQWLQVNLGRLFNLRGVATQGRHDHNQWVTSFSLSYTADDFIWVFIKENSQVKTFLANSDRKTVVKHIFSPDIRVFARSVRFHPKGWKNHISMRVEIYGC